VLVLLDFHYSERLNCAGLHGKIALRSSVSTNSRNAAGSGTTLLGKNLMHTVNRFPRQISTCGQMRRRNVSSTQTTRLSSISMKTQCRLTCLETTSGITFCDVFPKFRSHNTSSLRRSRTTFTTTMKLKNSLQSCRTSIQKPAKSKNLIMLLSLLVTILFPTFRRSRA
jgi:hypothetical protein